MCVAFVGVWHRRGTTLRSSPAKTLRFLFTTRDRTHVIDPIGCQAGSCSRVVRPARGPRLPTGQRPERDVPPVRALRGRSAPTYDVHRVCVSQRARMTHQHPSQLESAPRGRFCREGEARVDHCSRPGVICAVELLEALAVRVKLQRTEWRVLAVVLSSPRPVSASSVATRLRLDYGFVKRVVRGLACWNIIERTALGLRFQPDHTKWGPPRPQQR